MSALLEAAHQAAKLAQAHGADEAKVSVSRSRGVDIEWRDGKLERVQERTRRSLSAEIYADGRYSASSTSDLRPEALDVFLKDAVGMTKLLEPDVHRGLPDAERYQGRADVDLQLADPGQQNMTSEQRLALAEQLEQMVRDKAGDLPIVSVATNVSDTHGRSARVHTNGFEGVREGTSFSFSAMVVRISSIACWCPSSMYWWPSSVRCSAAVSSMSCDTCAQCPAHPALAWLKPGGWVAPKFWMLAIPASSIARRCSCGSQ